MEELVPQNKAYSTHFVQIGERTSDEDTAELLRFTGRELSRLLKDVSQQSGVDFTLYETRSEGYKLYVRQWHLKEDSGASTGETGAHILRIRGELYSEEEARENHPEIFEELLKRAQE